jgi:uroporphyrinogen decarboxylase
VEENARPDDAQCAMIHNDREHAMSAMTTHERMTRMFEHREADRVPIFDGPWPSTIERWHREGMPAGADYVDYFDLDHGAWIGTDNSPRYEARVIEETDAQVTHTTPWGVTLRNWKHAGGTPEYLGFTIVDPESWGRAKERMAPSRDRVDWAHLEKNYPVWRQKGCWITAGLFFGFDITHSWVVGTERLLMALVTDPEWCMDMFGTFLDVQLALLDQVWDAGYTFDALFWPDDMGYKGNQFFGIDMYRALLKPYHKRAVDWAHAHGVKACLHSCGNINPLLPELVDIGIDALNPLEVKAGMDPVAVKKAHGDKLVIHGGVNAVLWTDPEAIEQEMRRVIPSLKQGGGYVFASDHSIPDAVSLDDFRRIIALAKELGSYA